MSRSGSPSQFNEERVQVFAAIEAFFDSGTVRIFTGSGTLTIDSNDYTGSENILSISSVEETSDIKATGLSIAFSSYSDSLITKAMKEQYQNRLLNVYYGHFDKNASPQVIQTYKIFSGNIDTIAISESATGATYTINVESKLATLERVRSYRYTYEEQLRVHRDHSLYYLNDQQFKEVTWE
jgi:hypothetical protein